MADVEPPYCGVCVAALNDDGRCPYCKAGWDLPGLHLSQVEAAIFRQALDEGDGDDVDWDNAWLAVDQYREFEARRVRA